MAKSKKLFDREEMYKKIMPSSNRASNEDTNQEIRSQKSPDQEIYDNHIEASEEITKPNTENSNKTEPLTTVFKNKEIPWKPTTNNEDEYLYNVTEYIVIEKLEVALKKMSCCRCDRCREDIIALALNSLKPMYVVASKDKIDKKIVISEQIGLEVTTAVLKAILTVRKNPRH